MRYDRRQGMTNLPKLIFVLIKIVNLPMYQNLKINDCLNIRLIGLAGMRRFVYLELLMHRMRLDIMGKIVIGLGKVDQYELPVVRIYHRYYFLI